MRKLASAKKSGLVYSLGEGGLLCACCNSKPMEIIGLDGHGVLCTPLLGGHWPISRFAMRWLKEIAMGTLTSEEGTLAAPYFEATLRAF